MNGPSIKQLLPAFARVVLIRGDCEFTVQDILTHAWFLGELQAPSRELMKGLAYAEFASESGEEPEDDLLNSMSEEFRYERDLLTVEETEQWLSARDLTEQDFTEYLVRCYWRDHPPETTGIKDCDYVSASAEDRELLRVELLLSGRFDELTRALSWRLAASAGSDNTETDVALAREEHARFFERTNLNQASLPEALKQLDRTSAWLEECVQMEVRYRQTADSLLSDQARARTLAAMRLPLTQVNIQTLTFGSREAAQEAVLCLTEDQVSPEELAKECDICWEKQDLFLGDLAPEVQQRFLSAAAGEVLSPEAVEEGFAVIRMIAKTEPVLVDNAVRTRIDQLLLESHFSDLSSKQIRCVLGGPTQS